MNKLQVRVSLCILLGILMVYQYRAANAGQKYLSIKEMYTYSTELDNVKSEMKQLSQKKEDLKLEIEAYITAKEDNRVDYETFLKTEIDNMKAISGLTTVEGPGVLVIIQDGIRDLHESEDPNGLLVHDLDIRSVVDDLRNAGAEAIAINDQRVVFGKTKIVCTGPTIQINNQAFAPPYVIKAIGDRNFLSAAVNAPGSFTDSLRKWGVFIEVNTSVSINIPAFEPIGF